MAALDWLQQLLGGDPSIPAMPTEPLGQGQGYTADVLQHLKDVIGGKVAAGGALAQNNYDPRASFAQNALNPAGIEAATDVAFGIGPGAIRAYHGSPHSFDKFDLSKIGTGEGAQAYGHGLYFAEAEPVAAGYRESLANPQLYVGGNKVGEIGALGNDPIANAAHALLSGGSPQAAKAHVHEAMRRQAEGGYGYSQRLGGDILKAIDDIGSAPIERRPGGHMYEVDIHADPKSFLDWDRPLGQQSQRVRDVIAGRTDWAAPDMPASDVYARLSLGGGDPRAPGTAWAARESAPAASRQLSEAGIPGIRYLDQGSRIDPAATQQKIKLYEGLIRNDPTAAERAGWQDRIAALQAELEKPQTSNYAVFDDKLIEILRKYGILPPLAAGGLLGAAEE